MTINYQTLGNSPDARQSSKSNVSGLHIGVAHSSSIFTEIPSCAWAYLGKDVWSVEK